MSPDEHALVGLAPRFENLWLINGSSGHGVMHSPALGQLVAEMILDGGAHTVDAHALRPSRFAEGDPNPEFHLLQLRSRLASAVADELHLPHLGRFIEAPVPELVVELRDRRAEGGGQGLVRGLPGAEGVQEAVDARDAVAGLDVVERPQPFVVAQNGQGGRVAVERGLDQGEGASVPLIL